MRHGSPKNPPIEAPRVSMMRTLAAWITSGGKAIVVQCTRVIRDALLHAVDCFVHAVRARLVHVVSPAESFN